jgi:hypothetical protein
MRPTPSWLWLSSLILACATGETGDACFDDFQCSSSSCTWGTCDDPLLALLFDLASLAEEGDSSDPPTYRPPVSRCTNLPEATCLKTPGCWARSDCYPEPSCFDFTDFSIDPACNECVSGCGERCMGSFECLPVD